MLLPPSFQEIAMRRFMLPFLGLILLGVVAAAERSAPRAAKLASVVAPFLDEQTIGLVVIDVSRVDVNAALALAGPPTEEMTEMGRELTSFVDAFKKQGGKELVAVWSLADLPEGPFLLVPLEAGTDADAIGKLFLNDAQHPGLAVKKRVGDVLFVGGTDAWKRVHDLKPTPRPDVEKALAATADNVVQVVFSPANETKRSFEENAPNLPKPLGGGATAAFTQGMQWAALGLKFAAQASARI